MTRIPRDRLNEALSAAASFGMDELSVDEHEVLLMAAQAWADAHPPIKVAPMRWLVTWSIEFDHDDDTSPQTVARLAWDVMHDPDSTATWFEVTDRDLDVTTTINIEEE